MECPACGFKHDNKELSSMDLCRLWAHLFGGNKETLPTKEQFEAMQKEGFLPTRAKTPNRSGDTYELHYGHYGWAVRYEWSKIAEQIKKRNTIAEEDSTTA